MRNDDFNTDMNATPLAVIVVTYNPNMDALIPNLMQLQDNDRLIIISDNSTDDRVQGLLKQVSAVYGFEYLSNGGNLGIAAAQNIGIQHAEESGCDLVLFLDDDSALSGAAIGQLTRRYRDAWAADPSVGAVGPLITDSRSKEGLVFRWDGWRLRRHIGPYVDESIDVAFMLSSGTLTSLSNLREIGCMRSDFFIDHVDLEWGIRACAKGFRLIVCPTVEMSHSLADSVDSNSETGQHRYSHSNHVRDYYQARNILLLVRTSDLSVMKKIGLLGRLFREVYATISRRGEGRKLAYQLRGLWHGIRGKGGKLIE